MSVNIIASRSNPQRATTGTLFQTKSCKTEKSRGGYEKKTEIKSKQSSLCTVFPRCLCVKGFRGDVDAIRSFCFVHIWKQLSAIVCLFQDVWLGADEPNSWLARRQKIISLRGSRQHQLYETILIKPFSIQHHRRMVINNWENKVMWGCIGTQNVEIVSLARNVKCETGAEKLATTPRSSDTVPARPK